MASLYLFDGSHLSLRAFHAFPDLSLGDQPIGAVYGVVKMLTNFVRDFNPGKLVVGFDITKSKYRLSVYPEYKGHRHSDPAHEKKMERYYEQTQIIQDIVKCFGITTITNEAEGYECDDVASYLVQRFRDGRYPKVTQCILITSDKDWASLVGPGVVFYDPLKRGMITDKNFVDQFGIRVDQYPDFKALKGDTSDNIPHPHGIGDKTAVKLLNEYGSINKLLEAKHQKLVGKEDVLAQARKLVALNLHEQFPEDPVWGQIDQALATKIPFDPAATADILDQLSFHSLLETWETDREKWKAFSECSVD